MELFERLAYYGQQIVFERSTAKDGTAPTDLWIMNRNGTNIQLFEKEAHSPAWSPKALPVIHPTCSSANAIRGFA